MEHEFEGTPFAPEAKREMSPYKLHSPHHLAHKWRTPTLVIHGGKDNCLVEADLKPNPDPN